MMHLMTSRAAELMAGTIRRHACAVDECGRGWSGTAGHQSGCRGGQRGHLQISGPERARPAQDSVLLAELRGHLDATHFQVLNRAEQVDQASSYAVNSPGHHDVELAAVGIAEHPVETRALLPVFCAETPASL
jgi:hypothetical protein